MAESLKRQILQLVKQGYPYSHIVEVLGCTKGTISYHVKQNGLHPKNYRKPYTESEIKQFGEYYKTHTKNQTCAHFGISPHVLLKCNRKRIPRTAEEAKRLNYDRLRKRRKDRKEKAVAYKGGRCQKCGYSKSLKALEFHHRDMRKKDFVISAVRIYVAWDKLVKELDKCDLLCANCHREAHDTDGELGAV